MKDVRCPHSVLILKPSNLHIYSRFRGIYNFFSLFCRLMCVARFCFLIIRENLFFSNKLVKTNKLCQSGSSTQLWRNGEREILIVPLSGVFRITFLSSWCWMSPYSDISHIDLLTYAKQKTAARRQKRNCGDFLPLSSEGQNEQFQSTMKGHYVVLFAYTHTHTYRH